MYANQLNEGWADSPGLWSAEQVEGWRTVTDAVHTKGGRIFAQLWHTGAMSHPELLEGALPVSASNVDPRFKSVTPTGRKPTVSPRPMTREEIRAAVNEFHQAARNAIEAGFDGVQIQANYLYLIQQFLNTATNHRTDEYGGSMENRARFLFEVLEAVLQAVGSSSRVGVKIGPMNEVGAFAANKDTLPTHEYVISKLNDYKLAHLLIMGATSDFTGTPLEALAGDGMFMHFRKIFSGPLIANVGMTQERGNRLIASGIADLISFGQDYIANPDLVERFATDAALAKANPSTIYGSGPEGYVDYPLLARA